MSGHFLRDIPLRALQRKVGDERVTLLQACYDNPLFADDDDKEREAHAKGGGPRPTGGQDGHVTAPRDYVHTLPPTEMRFTTKSRRSILLRFIFSVLFLALVVALIIGLFVHFLREYTFPFSPPLFLFNNNFVTSYFSPFNNNNCIAHFGNFGRHNMI